MIIDAFKNKTFPLKKFDGDDDDNDDDEYYTPRELKTIRELSHSENEEETPRDMPDLETETFAAERREQSARGLKILTSQQMLSRLPISLAQLKAGNNSKKLKNEIRQLL